MSRDIFQLKPLLTVCPADRIMRVMKRASFLFIVVVLVLCSIVSTSFFFGDDCSAQITIYNKLPSEITVTIDGHSKRLPSWGSCTETADDGSQHVFPCSKMWQFSWESSLPFFPTFCSSLNEFGDEEDLDDPDYMESEEEEVCKDYNVDISFKGVDGLNRSLELSDHEHEILVMNENGLWKVKNPYLDHPEHLRDVYKWFEDAELHQP